VLLREGTVSVVYDEFQRYDNRNYDVSFYTADARVAPTTPKLAYTIVATAQTGGEIRVSEDGKENPGELARLQNVIATLPAVEVLEPGRSAPALASIPRAASRGVVD
jgi:hypothetical protein